MVGSCVVDANVPVGIAEERDHRHRHATALAEEMEPSFGLPDHLGAPPDAASVEDTWGVVQRSDGRPNFEDSLTVCLLREGVADEITTLDKDFEGLEGARRMSAQR